MKIGKLEEVLTKDYQCRRQMMIKRFQVTLESFAWGEKQKVCVSNDCTSVIYAVIILFEI